MFFSILKNKIVDNSVKMYTGFDAQNCARSSWVFIVTEHFNIVVNETALIVQ